MPKKTIKPSLATYTEERYQRNKALAILEPELASLAATPHVLVGQGFKDYIGQFFANDQKALDDAEKVFALLNDDGAGVKNKKNTAVGYRMTRVADIFKLIKGLPMDMFDAPLDAPIDGQERFTTQFFNAQFRFPEKEATTGNPTIDFVALLHYCDLFMRSVSTAFGGFLEANALKIYSPQTKKIYDAYVAEMHDLFKAASRQMKSASNIIVNYMDGWVASPLENSAIQNDIVNQAPNPVVPAKTVQDFLQQYRKKMADLDLYEG